MSDQPPLEPAPGEPIIAWQFENLRKIDARDLAIRFAFGAVVSMIASIMGLAFTPTVGGLFLAFPAILPASLTLLEQKSDTAAARHNVRGAVLGAVGLTGFAVVAAARFDRAYVGIALIAALAAWIAISVALYLFTAALQRRHKPRAATLPPTFVALGGTCAQTDSRSSNRSNSSRSGDSVHVSDLQSDTSARRAGT
ncbi:MAG TPA: DUF3147 family protein [Acidimicrobiia bacterium]|nr:DUF3147 family protein [Acidimicrobiia bacterium]